MRGPHDVGGLPAGPVDTSVHDPDLLEKQIDAMIMLLVRKGITRVDEMRRNIEAIGHDAYESLPYYDKWAAGLMRIVVDKGVLSQDEIDAQVKAIRQRLEQTGNIESD